MDFLLKIHLGVQLIHLMYQQGNRIHVLASLLCILILSGWARVRDPTVFDLEKIIFFQSKFGKMLFGVLVLVVSSKNVILILVYQWDYQQ
jgi:hypothetical protein